MKSLNRRDFLKYSLLGTMTIASPRLLFSKNNKETTKPNIIVILVDDMGYSDVGCYGGEIDTPNIDYLAENGLRFTQFYNCSKCAPTRASLLTGLYNRQAGSKSQPAALKNTITLGEGMKLGGYSTIMSGKWHEKGTPVNRGFDRYFGFLDGVTNYFLGSNTLRLENKEYTAPKKGFYATDDFTDYAIEKIKQANKPFFLYLAYNAPHWPLQALPEDIAKYKGKYMKGWDAIRTERLKRMKQIDIVPGYVSKPARDMRIESFKKIEDKEKLDERMAIYAAMIDRVDQNIGRLINTLKSLNIEENTLIMFLSDNGACAGGGPYGSDTFKRGEKDKEKLGYYLSAGASPGSGGTYSFLGRAWANASNTPLRKYKANPYEGGIRTPFITYWPSIIKQKGKITDQIGHVMDIMATVLDIGGINYPQKYKGKEIIPLAGKSLLPIFHGNKREGHDILYFARKDDWAIRKGKWKMVKPNTKSTWELYDLENDLIESIDLAEEHPEIVKKLSSLHATWLEKVNRQGGIRK